MSARAFAATGVAVAVALAAQGRQPGRDLPGASASPPRAADRLSAPVSITPRVHLPSARAVRVPASAVEPGGGLGSPAVGAVPAVAMAAYQRAATVIDVVVPSCHLDWTLLGAIGQIESGQGTANGSHLDAHGVARPPIIGPRLDGRHGTALVRDTDDGRLDHDPLYDHAVGPMQFLPSTWAVVAVDADGDGQRNVQDINDAALGSAVYLCAGRDDLATAAGRRAALLRYNHSASYVAMVLAVARGLSRSVLGPTWIRTISYAVPGRHRHVRSTPTEQPTGQPSTDPSERPTASAPTGLPTTLPSTSPTTSLPTTLPTTSPPTSEPPTLPVPLPTGDPTLPIPLPTGLPTASPPTSLPTTSPPTSLPTTLPTTSPPTGQPTLPIPVPTLPIPLPTTLPPTPVIPAPRPVPLAALTRAEVVAFDIAWPVCQAVLPDTWTRRDLRLCLTTELGTPRRDRHVRAFAQWLAKLEERPPG